MAEPTTQQSSPVFGRACILLAAVLWSSSGLFVKTIALPPTTVALYRSLLAGLVLLSLFGLRRGRVSVEPAMLLMILSFGLMNYVFVASMTYTTAANTIFLQYTAPVWMTLGSILLLKEATDRRQTVVLLGSLVGVAVILIGNQSLGSTSQLGMGLGLLSGFFYAGVAVSLRYLRRHDSLWLAALNHLGAAGLIAVIQLSVVAAGQGSLDELAFPTDPKKALLLALFGTFQMGIPYVLFGIGLKTVSPQEAGILALVEPILNPLWTYLGAGEVPTASTLAGGAILLVMLAARYAPARGTHRP